MKLMKEQGRVTDTITNGSKQKSIFTERLTQQRKKDKEYEIKRINRKNMKSKEYWHSNHTSYSV